MRIKIVHKVFTVFNIHIGLMLLRGFTRQVPYVEQELLTLPEYLIAVSMCCLVDHCLSFLIWLIYCLFFDLRLLVGPLVSFQKYWLSNRHILNVPYERYSIVRTNIDIYVLLSIKLCRITYYFFLNVSK